ncbi:poly-beta-1,6-N-acetyl-D-glucosamine synthase [Halomonas sp. HL-93]|uniref:poly-beta-1,6-N-acetyl-D-glucosamine synthase n=1 Tax=Halomonas sp. HL-93 TaxID=1666906 RepID=UPI0006D99623|nr:poly-beta-1,6-N-acetyl-D-glucosamine synthase [Halomonas sp. HL-93]KPQ24519.1 MAG: poly-beta-1,6 N-acetyl-D-glucosamine synthase [Halomonas sp. HL-93]SBR48387.1 biofilm PGA synthesis N-glycosyltransferase PgaC [Halomonas sp. HL-93]
MNLLDYLAIFTLGYPSLMATIWICGGLYFYWHWELKQPWPATFEWDETAPTVTVLLPCYNEEANVEETIHHLFKQNYPHMEVIAINDGSLDDTADRLNGLSLIYPALTVLHQANEGKASAMNHGLSKANGEIIVGIDGDAILDYDAIGYMVGHFISSPNVSGVTGNPRVRTRSTAIGKIQTGEFSAIIGLIKRAQRIYGMVFTVSGVICAFRRKALEEIGGWNTDMVTEDIDVSWRLQLAGGQVRYEPRALCWVLMPETLRGLFKQRLRWAQGGGEVFLRYFPQTIRWANRRFWLLTLEYIISVMWCYSVITLLLVWLVSQLVAPTAWPITAHLLSYFGSILVALSFIQFTVSFHIDSRYDKEIFRCIYWMIWYPFAYWILNMTTVVIAFPKALLRQKGRQATWTSPDRGEHFNEQ